MSEVLKFVVMQYFILPNICLFLHHSFQPLPIDELRHALAVRVFVCSRRSTLLSPEQIMEMNKHLIKMELSIRDFQITDARNMGSAVPN
jgi:hypothetical protein